MEFSFFNVEIIHVFNSNFVDIRSATSHPFGFKSIIKQPNIYILKLLVNTLRNQDNKVVCIQVDKDITMVRSSEFMRKCHNMNIIVSTSVGDKASLNGKIESPDKTLNNIARNFLLNSIPEK